MDHLKNIAKIQSELKAEFDKDTFLNTLSEKDIIEHFGLRALIKMVYDARGEQYILDRLKVLNNQ